MHESNSTLSHLPRKRGRKPKPIVAELPKVRVSALQLWSLRECARVLAVSRERVQAAIAAGDLPAESSGQHSRRVLATDAVKALAPHLLERLQLL